MLILKSVDNMLNYSFVIGEEVPNRINFALFGTIPGHRFLELMNNFYSLTEFNEFSLPVITHTFKSTINKSILSDNERIFSQVYFYALSYENRDKDYDLYTTPNSYAVHLWEHSWKENEKSNAWILLRRINTVLIDYLFYGYSKQYLTRYLRGFSRQLYHYLFSRKS